MKNLTKAIVILSSSILLAGCVIDEGSDYYSGDEIYYSSVTSGYNRDYHKRRESHKNKGYYSSGSTGGTQYNPPPKPSSGYYSSGSTGYSGSGHHSGYRSSGSTGQASPPASADSHNTPPASDGYYSSGSNGSSSGSGGYSSSGSSDASSGNSGYSSSGSSSEKVTDNSGYVSSGSSAPVAAGDMINAMVPGGGYRSLGSN